jgi:hypothetical protein
MHSKTTPKRTELKKFKARSSGDAVFAGDLSRLVF